MPEVLEPAVFFGQLQHVFVVHLEASTLLKLAKSTTIILAVIRACSDLQLKDNNIYYYKREGRTVVVDMGCVQAVVGRVTDGGGWAIVDRSEDATRPVFILDE